MITTTTTCSGIMKKAKNLDTRKQTNTTNTTTRNSHDKDNNKENQRRAQKVSLVPPNIVRDQLELYINASSSSSSSSFEQVILKRLETNNPNHSKYFIRRSFDRFMNPNTYKRKNPWNAIRSKISGKIYQVAVRFLQEQKQRNALMDIVIQTTRSTAAATTTMNTLFKGNNTAHHSSNSNSKTIGTSQIMKQHSMKRMSLIVAVKGVDEPTVSDSRLEAILENKPSNVERLKNEITNPIPRMRHDRRRSNSKKSKILSRRRDNKKLAKKRRFTNIDKNYITSTKDACIETGNDDGLSHDNKRFKRKDNRYRVKRISLINDVKGVDENTVYDSCLEVISKIEDFLKEDGITKAGLCYCLGNIFPNSLNLFLSTKTKNTKSNLQNAGCAMICYRYAYVFFEKKRILENQPKSVERLKNEIVYPNGFPLRRKYRSQKTTFL